jgi:hypothetical protein
VRIPIEGTNTVLGITLAEPTVRQFAGEWRRPRLIRH